MGSGANPGSPARGPTHKTKGQKRLERILEGISIAREQLLAAIDDLAPQFTVDRDSRGHAVRGSARAKQGCRDRARAGRADRLPGGAGLTRARRGAASWRHAQRRGSSLGASRRTARDLGGRRHPASKRQGHAQRARPRLPTVSWRALHQAVESLLARSSTATRSRSPIGSRNAASSLLPPSRLISVGELGAVVWLTKASPFTLINRIPVRRRNGRRGRACSP